MLYILCSRGSVQEFSNEIHISGMIFTTGKHINKCSNSVYLNTSDTWVQFSSNEIHISRDDIHDWHDTSLSAHLQVVIKR